MKHVLKLRKTKRIHTYGLDTLKSITINTIHLTIGSFLTQAEMKTNTFRIINLNFGA